MNTNLHKMDNELLPEEIECPNCGVLLELSDKERYERKFICSECQTLVQSLQKQNENQVNDKPTPSGNVNSSGVTTCWKCGNSLLKEATVCPYCGLSRVKESESNRIEENTMEENEDPEISEIEVSEKESAKEINEEVNPETMEIDEEILEEDYVNDEPETTLPEKESDSSMREEVEITEEKYEKKAEVFYLNDKSPQALMITCVDPRFRDSFSDFGKAEFGHFILLAIPGGIGPLTLDLMPKPAEIFRRQIKHILKGSGLKKIILIAHADCKWYDLNQGYYTNPLLKQQKMDLQSAKSILEERFEDVEILCYNAEIKDNMIEFLPLNE